MAEVVRHSAAIAAFLVASLSAIGPGSASAESGFYELGFPATISGIQKENAVIQLESGFKVTCESSTFEASIIEPSEAAETLSVTPAYSKCTTALGSATVATAGCKYVLHGGEEIAANEFSGSFDISCSLENKIVITSATCEAQIGGQSALNSVTYVDDTSATPVDYTAAPSTNALKYTVSKDGIFCPFAGTGAKEKGVISQKELMTAKAEEEAVGTYVDKPTVLCEIKEAECKKPVAGGSAIQSTATNTVFKDPDTTFEVKCTSSSMELKTTNIRGDPLLPGTLVSLTWTGCTDQNGKSCTVKTQAGNSTNVLFGADDRAAQLGNGGFNPYPLNIEINCADAGVNCKFGSKGVPGGMTGGSPAALSVGGGFKYEGKCTIASVFWTATYSVSSPKPLYVTN